MINWQIFYWKKEVIFKENVEEIFGKRPWDKEERTDKKSSEPEALEKEKPTEGEEVVTVDE